ncbi:MAG: CDP-glycerol glycerophosphotransferase family protein [Pyrinomonadaceae bacterium]
MKATRLLALARELDKQWQRRRRPDQRRVLVNSRTPMNYSTVAPIVERLQRDRRLEIYFTASENPRQTAYIYSEAHKPFHFMTPFLAAFVRFDAYLASDFLWVNLARGTRRVQTFHGVAGKYRSIYDSPSHSMRQWDRLFFINKHRHQHFIASGAIDESSASARLTGMPKLDCLVDGSLSREQVFRSLHLDPDRKTVMYAPTWSPHSSLSQYGETLVRRLTDAGYNVIVKLHDRSRDTRYLHSGGENWHDRLAHLIKPPQGVLASSSNSSFYLVAADLLVTDHSSVGFEYLLLDRPVVRIHIPKLIEATDIEPLYVQMLASASKSATHIDEVMQAIAKSFEDPSQLSETRRFVANEMFYKPGSATDRAVKEMYEVLELPSH